MTQQIRRVESTVETPRYTLPASEPVLYTFTAAALGGVFAGVCGYILRLDGMMWWALVLGVGALTGYPVLLYTVWMHYALKRGQFQSRTTSEEYEVLPLTRRVNAVPHYEGGGVRLTYGAQAVTLPLPNGDSFTVTTAMIGEIRVCAMTRGGQLVEAEMPAFNSNTYRDFRAAATHYDPPLIEGVNRTRLTEMGHEVFGIPYPDATGWGEE